MLRRFKVRLPVYLCSTGENDADNYIYRTGLDFLPSSSSSSCAFLASSAVDQRLNLYSLTAPPPSSLSTPPPFQLKLVDSTPLEVADCGTQEVVASEGGRVRVVVGGIGVEVVEVGFETEKGMTGEEAASNAGGSEAEQ
jgi:hypothetical protein